MRVCEKDPRRPDRPRRGRVSRDHGATLPFSFKNTMDKLNSQDNEQRVRQWDGPMGSPAGCCSRRESAARTEEAAPILSVLAIQE
jgi:hypothetical protein